MNAGNVILWVLILGIMPVGAGAAVCRLLEVKTHPAGWYLTGMFAEWAIFQLVSVPMIWFRMRFTPLWIGMTVILGTLAVLGWFGEIRDRVRKMRPSEWRKPGAAALIALALMTAGYLFLAYELAVHQRPDKDDARFVVAALDIVNSDKLFLVDPSTGLPIVRISHDFARDAVAPFTVYIAYVAQVTGTNAAIIAHSVLQQSLMLGIAAVCWLLGERFFPGDLLARCGLVILVFLMIVFGDHVAVLENVALWRIWQGKAVLAAIGVPFACWAGAGISDQLRKWKPYLFFYVVMLAFCFLSNTGYLLGMLLCAGFGIAYGIRSKSVWVTLKCCVPMVFFLAYYGIYLLYK